MTGDIHDLIKKQRAAILRAASKAAMGQVPAQDIDEADRLNDLIQRRAEDMNPLHTDCTQEPKT